MMSQDLRQDAPPSVVARIPGPWKQPTSLAQALPDGYRLSGGRLQLPGGRQVQFGAMAADSGFRKVFVSACRRPPLPEQRSAIDRCRAAVCLITPGGSMEAARRILEAAAAVVRAGGLGVLIDTSFIAHRRGDWLEHASHPGVDGLLRAFIRPLVSVDELWSLGMHAMGLRDIVMPRSGDHEEDCITLESVLDYTLTTDLIIADGDLIGDIAPRFRLHKEPSCRFGPDSPLHNPHGQWRLEPFVPDGDGGNVQPSQP